jgi:hypothetical protein
MYSATADECAFSAIRFRKPNSTYLWFSAAARESEAPAATGADADTESVPSINQPSDNRPDLLIGPVPIPADWLATVERRIRESINPYDVEYVNDGRWLTSTIAMQAMRFFQSTSDVLPGEPYIYSSMQGDLVAEFRAVHGSITSIIGTTSVVAFAVVNGEVVKEKLEFRSENLAAARQELKRLTDKLRTGQHGAVETTTK